MHDLAVLDPASRPTPTAGDASGPAITQPAVLRGEALVKRFGSTEALRGIDVASGAARSSPSWARAAREVDAAALPRGIIVPDGAGPFAARGSTTWATPNAAACGARRSGSSSSSASSSRSCRRRERGAAAAAQRRRPRRRRRMPRPWFPRLGLEGLEGRRPGEMSGGQAQRVAIARALVIEPAVVFADEPTGSLDRLAGEQVMELLTEAARARATAVVLVTHEPRIAAYADREVIVRDGRIARRGR